MMKTGGKTIQRERHPGGKTEITLATNKYARHGRVESRLEYGPDEARS